MTAPRFWLAVASANHVRRGRAEGFMQVCHGKRGPLARVKPGDGVVYYSPTEVFGEKAPCRALTAIGFAREREPYAFDMGGGFVPFRRDVDWCEARETPIHPLLPRLDLARDGANWGYKLRFGLIAITAADFAVIGQAMDAGGPEWTARVLPSVNAA
jgi:hypothetical protein